MLVPLPAESVSSNRQSHTCGMRNYATSFVLMTQSYTARLSTRRSVAQTKFLMLPGPTDICSVAFLAHIGPSRDPYISRECKALPDIAVECDARARE
jgi:hypothetical protein